MNLTDAIIIYFTLGTPVGMYAFVRTRDESLYIHLARAVAELFTWPAALALAFHRDAFDPLSVRALREPERLRSNLVESLFAEARLRSPFKGEAGGLAGFKLAVERYVGLTAASRADVSLSGSALLELHEAAGHPRTDLAASCIMRKNMLVLERHRAASAAEFRALFTHSSGAELMGPAILLAESLGDGETADQISRLVADTETALTPIPLPGPARTSRAA